MTTLPIPVTLFPHTLGDRWEGILRIGPIIIDGAPPDLLLRRVLMVLHLGTVDFKLDSDDGGDATITITDAATWDVTIPPVANFLPSVGSWNWEMKFYAGEEATPTTLYKGAIEVTSNLR